MNDCPIRWPVPPKGRSQPSYGAVMYIPPVVQSHSASRHTNYDPIKNTLKALRRSKTSQSEGRFLPVLGPGFQGHWRWSGQWVSKGPACLVGLWLHGPWSTLLCPSITFLSSSGGNRTCPSRSISWLWVLYSSAFHTSFLCIYTL